jgi:hypothetical protein
MTSKTKIDEINKTAEFFESQREFYRTDGNTRLGRACELACEALEKYSALLIESLEKGASADGE